MALLHGEPATEPGAERDNFFIDLPASSADQTRATLDAMVKLTRVYSKTLPVRDRAEQIITGVPEKDYWAEASVIQAWVRDTVRYTRDVLDVETLKTPLETLRSLQGDCDDKALLSGALLQSVGFKVRYVAVGYTEPNQFEHVYAEVAIGQHWVPVETTEPVNFGWTPARPRAYYVAHV